MLGRRDVYDDQVEVDPHVCTPQKKQRTDNSLFNCDEYGQQGIILRTTPSMKSDVPDEVPVSECGSLEHGDIPFGIDSPIIQQGVVFWLVRWQQNRLMLQDSYQSEDQLAKWNKSWFDQMRAAFHQNLEQ